MPRLQTEPLTNLGVLLGLSLRASQGPSPDFTLGRARSDIRTAAADNYRAADFHRQPSVRLTKMEETLETIRARHREEQRKLQARIAQKKKSATKKTRRGVNDECERLQRELDERQKAEIAAFLGEPLDDTADRLEVLNLDDDTTQEPNGTVEEKAKAEPAAKQNTTSQSQPPNGTMPPRQRKPNRHKARLARREAERAAQAAAAAEEAANQADHRGNEKELMEAAFKRHGLKEIEINPDGHCLYSAIACQLDELGLGLRPNPERFPVSSTTASRIDTVASPLHDGYRAVRAVTADFIQQHADEFAPFMEEPLEEYVRKVRLTGEWGGQLELQAIARAYGVDINVLQGDGRIEKIEAGDADVDERPQIWLAYYRHTYGLGEHYNALTKR